MSTAKHSTSSLTASHGELDVINPHPIDPQATIFYIDLRHYEWDRIDGWTKIEEEYPFHISV